jgi:putative exosortase-associated protein (TIGR04073 family)
MRNVTPFLAIIGLTALFTAGCAGPEEKFGRGIDNTFEVVRMGELSRSVEQTSIFDSPGAGYTTGFVRGLNRSLARTGLGLYEIVTFPIPPYHPVATKYLSPEPAYPDNYKPGLPDDPLFDTDAFTGYSGGTFLPFLPGNRFNVFD